MTTESPGDVILTPPQPPPQQSPLEPVKLETEPALGQQHTDHFAVQVLYATDRLWDAHEETFAADRGPRLQYGFCNVGIPERHEPGELEEPGFLRSEKPSRHVILATPTIAPQDEFLRRLRAKVRGSQRREIFVFIHGALTTFEHAARRTGQIAFDIGLDGVPILYSWPTEGRVSGYLVDRTNAEWTQPHLSRFLQMLLQKSGARRIHLLAHSMGNGLVTRAIRDLSRRDPCLPAPAFDQIILVAADLDSEVFARDLAPSTAASAHRVTLYISDKDRALSSSRKLHKYPRLGAGRDPLAALAELLNLDLIDVGAVTEDWLGHDYYAGNPIFLKELRAVLQGRTAPERGLEFVDDLYRLTGPAEE